MKNLSKARRNEIAFKIMLDQIAHQGMHFPKANNKSRKKMQKLGISGKELAAFASEVAGKLTKKSLG